MKKSDLKTGMWVIVKHGGKGMVLLGTNNGDIISGDTRWGSLDEYDDNLIRTNQNHNYDIVKIIQPTTNFDYYNINKDTKHIVIWDKEKEEQNKKATLLNCTTEELITEINKRTNKNMHNSLLGTEITK
jgi:hypothetical protein